MKTQLPATYNVALKTAIVAAHFTQRAVARKAGIHETRFTRILNGEYPATDAEKRKLARILQRHAVELFPEAA